MREAVIRAGATVAGTQDARHWRGFLPHRGPPSAVTNDSRVRRARARTGGRPEGA